ncbi:MAG: Gfo/Idh/MocA family oxidoreductase, partial [Alicyclobacillus macrosporangiidus]|nr:Gfo/Idh/MocA family oxidoreductase [Alicyclobacillus macrosporangiidus]
MPIRVGIIGTGFGATVHAPILKQHPKYDLVSIASMRPGRATDVAVDLGIPNAYDDWRQMMNAGGLDLIVIATKPGLHAEMVEHALSTSHHVLCEKPPALNGSEAERMAEVSHGSARVAAMNFEWRYLPERQAVQRILNGRQLGDIIQVNWSEVWPLWPQIRESEASWHWLAEEG